MTIFIPMTNVIENAYCQIKFKNSSSPFYIFSSQILYVNDRCLLRGSESKEEWDVKCESEFPPLTTINVYDDKVFFDKTHTKNKTIFCFLCESIADEKASQFFVACNFLFLR